MKSHVLKLFCGNRCLFTLHVSSASLYYSLLATETTFAFYNTPQKNQLNKNNNKLNNNQKKKKIDNKNNNYKIPYQAYQNKTKHKSPTKQTKQQTKNKNA